MRDLHVGSIPRAAGRKFVRNLRRQTDITTSSACLPNRVCTELFPRPLITRRHQETEDTFAYGVGVLVWIDARARPRGAWLAIASSCTGVYT